METFGRDLSRNFAVCSFALLILLRSYLTLHIMAHARSLETYMPNTKKSLENYDKGFKAVLKGQKQESIAFAGLLSKVDACKQIEPYDGMKSVLSDTAITNNRLQEQVLDKLDDLKVFTYKPQEKLLRDVKSNLTKKNKLANSKNVDPVKLAEAKKNYKDSLRDFLDKMEQFEMDRLGELKSILIEFCNSQLYFHTKAVETWAHALQKASEMSSNEWKTDLKNAVEIEKDNKNIDDDYETDDDSDGSAY